jgi:hypothetical protein
VISCAEINFGVNAGSTRGIEEVRHQGKQILVLPSNMVKGSVIDAKVKGTIFLFNE